MTSILCLVLYLTKGGCILFGRVGDPHHLNVDPDPAFHLNADLNPAFHLNADPDPALLTLIRTGSSPFHFNPDPSFHLNGDPYPALFTSPGSSSKFAPTGEQVLQGILSLHASIVSVHGPPRLHVEPPKLLNFD
jgi:hypothetical protein